MNRALTGNCRIDLKRPGFWVVLTCCVILAGGLRAQTVDFSSRTFVLGFTERANGDIVGRVPLYEFVELTARDLGVDGLNLYASGYGMVNLYQLGGDRRGWGDLDVAYLEYQDPMGRFQVRGGRMLLFGPGTFGDMIDGGSFAYYGPGGFTISGFGGANVIEGFGDNADSWMVGGRVGDRLMWAAGLTDIGVNFVRKVTGGSVDRELIGVDFTYYAPAYVDLGGDFLYDDITEKVQEGQVQVGIRPHHAVSIGLDYRYLNPALFLSKSSIFSVFGGDDQHRAGLAVDGRIGSWGVHGDFDYIFFENESNGYAADAGFRYIFAEQAGSLGLDAGRYRDYTNGYTFARVWASYRLPGWFARRVILTGDVQFHYLDDEIDSFAYSLYSAFSLTYRSPIGLDLTAVGRFRRGPSCLYDVAGEFRLSYFFGTGGKR